MDRSAPGVTRACRPRQPLSKGLSGTPGYPRNDPAGSQALPGSGNSTSLLASLAIGDVPGRSQDHPANGNAAQPFSRLGSKRTLYPAHCTQSDALSYGPSRPTGAGAPGTHQLQGQPRCAPTLCSSYKSGPFPQEASATVAGTASN